MKHLPIFLVLIITVATSCMNEKMIPVYTQTTSNNVTQNNVSNICNTNSNLIPLYVTQPHEFHPTCVQFIPNMQKIQSKPNNLFFSLPQTIEDMQRLLTQESEYNTQIKKEIEERNKTIINFSAESKKIINSINMSINTDIMKRLYHQAWNFTHSHLTGYFVKPTDLQKTELVDVIKTMRNAHNYDINEDSMAQYCYNQASILYDACTILPFVFSCLKQYQATIVQTSELLSDDINQQIIEKPQQKLLDEDVAQALGIIQIKKTDNNQATTNKYPAYQSLTKNLATLFNRNPLAIRTLIACIYQNKNILTSASSIKNYNDLANNFYSEAHTLIQNFNYYSNANKNQIYKLTLILDELQNTKEIENIGYTLLNHKPTFSESFNLPVFYSSEYLINHNNTITLLYVLVEKYTHLRKNKIIPTPEQFLCYQLIKDADLALPDSFDNAIFNENTYALSEFADLIKNINTIFSLTNEQEKQKCIDILFPEKKQTK